MRKKNKLTIVGTGIKFYSHLTVESKAHIEKADKLFFLVNDVLTHEWLLSANKTAESLEPIYLSESTRIASYERIANYVSDFFTSNIGHICVVFYGHPCFCVYSSIEIASIAKSRGVDVEILPAISAEDALYSDLRINPMSHGCQTYDATDFLLRKYNFDPNSHLILLQLASVGILDHKDTENNSKNLSCLVDYLLAYYPNTHIAILYEASQKPHTEPIIRHIALADIKITMLNEKTTLYLQPISLKKPDPSTLSQLGIEAS